jgi:predicted N-acetyltransferase YhbS
MTDEFRVVRADELEAMFDLRARAFKQGTGPDWAASADRDPWRDAGADLVAVGAGRVVATVRLLARRVAAGDGELRLAGFGAVASDPAVRRQGYIRRLLATAHARNRADGYDLAMLFTGSPWVYSGSAGFSDLSFSALHVDFRRALPPTIAWTIAPADLDRHLRGMQQVYDAFGQGRPGYPLRDQAYWTHPARLTDASSTRVALDRDQRVAAYLRLRLTHDGRAIVQEFPYITAAAASAIVAGLAKDPALAPYATLSGCLPRDHVLGAAGEWRVRDDAMACAYTPAGASLLQTLRDPTEQRVVYWSGDDF